MRWAAIICVVAMAVIVIVSLRGQMKMNTSQKIKIKEQTISPYWQLFAPLIEIFIMWFILILLVMWSYSCSVVMESTRPKPTNISQFVIGEQRNHVIESIGAPIATVQDNGLSCDVYQLYTLGPSGIGKGAIAATEGVADVLTLGLAEIISSPIEAGTKSEKQTVTFCYDKYEQLASTRETV